MFYLTISIYFSVRFYKNWIYISVWTCWIIPGYYLIEMWGTKLTLKFGFFNFFVLKFNITTENINCWWIDRTYVRAMKISISLIFIGCLNVSGVKILNFLSLIIIIIIIIIFNIILKILNEIQFWIFLIFFLLTFRRIRHYLRWTNFILRLLVNFVLF